MRNNSHSSFGRIASVSGLLGLITAGAVFSAGILAKAADHHAAAGATPESTALSFEGEAYPLDYCIVTGDKLGEMGSVVRYNHEGRDIRFCCSDCIGDFESDPERYIAKLDAAIIAQQKNGYSAGICPVSEQPLDSMGGPEWIVVNNALIGLCCGGCEADVRGGPQKYINWVHGLIAEAQGADYQATTCPVTGDELGENPVDYFYAGRLVRFCCTDCVAKFNADPQKYLAVLDGGAEAKPAAAPAAHDEHAGHHH